MVLQAARDVFAERGFANARTREIAERAAVTEKVMFRHFPTKAALYHAAVFEPFGQVVDAYLEEFEDRVGRHLDAVDLARAYLVGLYRFLADNRAAILSLIAAYAHDPELFGPRQPGPLDHLLERLESAAERGVAEQGRGAIDARRTVRLTFGMVLSAAVTTPVLLVGEPEDPERDLDEMVAYVVAGVLRRDPDLGAPERSARARHR